MPVPVPQVCYYLALGQVGAAGCESSQGPSGAACAPFQHSTNPTAVQTGLPPSFLEKPRLSWNTARCFSFIVFFFFFLTKPFSFISKLIYDAFVMILYFLPQTHAFFKTTLWFLTHFKDFECNCLNLETHTAFECGNIEHMLKDVAQHLNSLWLLEMLRLHLLCVAFYFLNPHTYLRGIFKCQHPLCDWIWTSNECVSWRVHPCPSILCPSEPNPLQIITCEKQSTGVWVWWSFIWTENDEETLVQHRHYGPAEWGLWQWTIR